jgi:hypothetical protein
MAIWLVLVFIGGNKATRHRECMSKGVNYGIFINKNIKMGNRNFK